MQKDEKPMKASGFFQPILVIGKGSLPEYDRCQLPKGMCLLSLKGAHIQESEAFNEASGKRVKKIIGQKWKHGSSFIKRTVLTDRTWPSN